MIDSNRLMYQDVNPSFQSVKWVAKNTGSELYWEMDDQGSEQYSSATIMLDGNEPDIWKYAGILRITTIADTSLYIINASVSLLQHDTEEGAYKRVYSRPSNTGRIYSGSVYDYNLLEGTPWNKYTDDPNSDVKENKAIVIQGTVSLDGTYFSLENYINISLHSFEPWNVDGVRIPYTDSFENVDDLVFHPPYPPYLWRINRDKNQGFPMNGIMEASKPIGAFSNCPNLRSVIIPSTVTSIGQYAFRNTNLTSVTVPNGCKYYDTSFPEGCIVSEV